MKCKILSFEPILTIVFYFSKLTLSNVFDLQPRKIAFKILKLQPQLINQLLDYYRSYEMLEHGSEIYKTWKQDKVDQIDNKKENFKVFQITFCLLINKIIYYVIYKHLLYYHIFILYWYAWSYLSSHS